MRFRGLDVLRGLAAVYVMLSHYTSFCLKEFGEVPFHVPSETGNYAVWLFYMISGFVIYFTIERSKTWVDFAVSRATRLYPIYWITLTLVVITEWLSKDPTYGLSLYTPEYYQHIGMSVWRVTQAFILATLLGVPFGLFLGWSKKFREYMFPLFEMLRPIPILAWVPLAIVMFISTESAVIYLTFL